MFAAAKPRTNAEARARILARMEERLKRVYPDEGGVQTLPRAMALRVSRR